MLHISKRPEPVNLVHCPSCTWHEPFCYSRRRRPTPKNTLRGNPGCAVGPKTPTETSSSRQPTRAKLSKKKTPSASNDHDISFKTFDASYVLTNKSGKVVAKYVGGKHKGSKTCVWVPKVLVSNAKGPKTIWVPKVKN
jgi:hypothetical protein